MIKNNGLRTAAIIFALIGFGSGIGIYTAQQEKQEQVPQIPGMLWPQPKVLQAFSTRDQLGREFGLEQLRGKWSFLFFGYTHCPDICPITLNVFDQVYKNIDSEQRDSLQMLFVSVDPERDSEEKLRDYVAYFNQEFIGLGGSLEQVRSLTGQMGIAFFHEAPSAEGDYLVDHSASVFLVDPLGRVVGIISAPHQPEQMLSRFQDIRAFIERQAQS